MLTHHCTPSHIHRAAYSLTRLRVHDPALLSLIASHTTDRLATFTAESLAGLAAGLGAWGHRPSDTWLARFAVESFARLSQFNAQELSNTLFGLAQMEQRPSDVWLARCLQLMRGQWGGPRCHPPSLVKVGGAGSMRSLTVGCMRSQSDITCFLWCFLCLAAYPCCFRQSMLTCMHQRSPEVMNIGLQNSLIPLGRHPDFPGRHAG